jgi:hypothetical protein
MPAVMRALLAAGLGTLVLIGVAASALAFDLTTCGQIIHAGETGTLRGDLSCFVSFGPAVTMDGGTLELNGFAIRGGGRRVGVECVRQDGPGRPTCTIRGPGEISDFENGIDGGGCTVTIDGVALRRNRTGILLALDCDLQATNLTVTDGGTAIWANRLRGDGLVVSDNAGDGVKVNGRMRLRGLTAANNGVGVRARHGRLIDSVVSGSDTFDVLASGRLRLVRTLCATSGRVSRRFPDGERVSGRLRCEPGP